MINDDELFRKICDDVYYIILLVVLVVLNIFMCNVHFISHNDIIVLFFKFDNRYLLTLLSFNCLKLT